MTHVVVVGAGPAGLAAAAAAAEAGARVTLLDGAEHLGGQFWRHARADDDAPRAPRLQHAWSRYRALRDAVRRECEVVLGASVWAIDVSGERAVLHALVGEADGRAREPRSWRPDAVVLATGAHDRTLPFPGWDLPGVVTAGAAQAYAKAEGIALGRRVVVAGAGPFLLPAAVSAATAGSRVVGVYEANPLRTLASGWLPRAWRLAGAWRKGIEAAGYLADLARHRIPYRVGTAVVAAHGRERVEAVTIAALDATWRPVAGSERVVETDAVCVSHGFLPRLELPVAAGCALSAERFVVVDEDQRTSVPGFWAAGEITGIAGADAAIAEGRVAGASAAGAVPDPRALRMRARHGRFAERMHAAHGIRGGWTAWLTDETVVCRCEEVSYGRLVATLRHAPDAGLRSLKLATRAGLGICQARVCGRTVEELIVAERAPGDATSDARPLAIPVRLAELALGEDATPSQRKEHDV